MAWIDLSLKEFGEGCYLVWSVLAQCEKEITVTLQEKGNKENQYLIGQKGITAKTPQIIARGKHVFEKKTVPLLRIDIKDSGNFLQQYTCAGPIVNGLPNSVGYLYNIVVKGGDNGTWKDVYVNIAVWYKKPVGEED